MKENDGTNNRMAMSLIALGLMLVFAYLLYAQTSEISIPLLVVFGFLLAIMDTAIGMGFGTFGTPVLLIFGFSSKIVVPAILVSQLFGSAFGSVLHRRYGNVDVLDFKGRDGKIAALMVSLGIVGAVIGVALALSLPKVYVNSYIGILVVVMGLVLIARPKLSFSWTRAGVLSIVSGFNKAMSGGGYGPVSTTGLLVSGNKVRNSVGITVFSVAIINLVGFLLYLMTNSITTFVVMIALSVGAIFGSQIGPKITHKMELSRDTKIMGIIAVVLGILTIITTIW